MDCNNIKRFNMGSVKMPSHLIYADDLMIFTKGDILNLLKLNNILKVYMQASGQQINLSKRRFYTPKSTSTDQQARMARALSMNCGSLPFTYLGATLRRGILKKEDCNGLLSHVYKHLSSWYSRTLNQMGRLILIKRVLSSIPLHLIVVQSLPRSIISTLHSLMANFLWGHMDGRAKYHWRNWNFTCQNKNAGGLGIRDLLHMETTYSLKLWWKAQHDQGLWAKLVRAKYMKNGNIKERLPDSPTWKRICRVHSLGTTHMHWTNGQALWDNGQFSLKLAFNATEEKLPVLLSTKFIWHKAQIPKLRFFQWKIFNNCLPFPNNLRRFNLTLPSRYSFCLNNEESLDHCLVNCTESKKMASNNTYSHSINLRYILKSQKLSRENFLDWEKNLRIVLDCERKLYILEIDPPKTPAANARASELTSFKKYEDDARDVKCIIMASMTAELQRLHADMEVRPMVQRLRDLYQGQPQNSDIYVIEVNMSNFTSWVMVTGCGYHICTSMQNLHEVRHLTEGEVQLKVGNGALVNALAVGTYVLSLPSGFLLHLKNCLFVHAINRNIISVSCLDKAGFSINVKDKCLSVFRNDIYYATAKMTNGLYILDLDATVYNVDVKRSKPNSLNLTYLWHCRLGHINEKRISKLRHSGVLDSFDLESYDVCQSCLLGKMTKAPFTGHGERASDVLGLIHSDVCGPINTEARGRFSYFVTFTDDLSRYGYVYLMKHKSECFDKFKEFRNEVEKQLGKSIKTLRSDRGAHTLNRVPSKAVESTPYELWRGTKPNLSYLRIWGCDVYVRRLMTSGKLYSKSDRCKFLGYPKETKGYEFYHSTDNKIFVARNGTFLEKEFLSAISSGREVDLEEIREPQEEISIAVEPERQDLVSRPAQVLPRRSDRMRNPPVRYGFLVSNEGDER
ncbi:unnamed protein product [Cuscuta campestris]|uniref:Integrase catalytic domain-containing protein n=1 Tax=Cuscuta campestris TaxID=132261 RepID=A0A484NJM4_9ASTE|nr:unnamed protein product [Cuscuta campestris]